MGQLSPNQGNSDPSEGSEPQGGASPRPSELITNDEWRAIEVAWTLTGRQLQLVQCVFDAMGDAEIGRLMGISAHTVHSNLAKLYTKLEVRGRAEVIARVAVHFAEMNRVEDQR